MHVLMVSEYFPPHTMGGGELSAFALAKALVKRKTAVSVLTGYIPGDHVRETIAGVIVYRRLATGNALTVLGNIERFRFTHSVRKELLKLIDEIQPDILHAMNVTSMPGVAAVAQRRGIPAVAHINSPLAFDPKATLLEDGKEATRPYTLLRFVRSFLTARELGRRGNAWYLKYNPLAWVIIYRRWSRIRDSFSEFDLFMPISTAMQRWLERYGVPTKKTVVIPNIIGTGTFPEASPPTNKTAKIVYLSGYSRMKGLHVVLDALKGVKGAYELHCSGIGDERASLEAQAMKNRVAAVFHGLMTEDNELKLLAGADLLVFPSLVPEGLGRVALAAMALSKPVVASRIGGITDTVVDNRTGLLVEPGNVEAWHSAINALVRDPRKRRAMGAAGKRRFNAGFTEEAIVHKALTAYRGILS
ncbi:glycosyltransferase family 4 protein [Candidatus Woesearchaeota archaeon]|nr:glycosyltransferase family 4 protein [Candidatus Woesearchaeota archaeon]